MRRRGNAPWLVWIVLLCAAGLVGVGINGLSRAKEAAEARASEASRQRMRALAATLRRSLLHPSILDLAPAGSAFEVASGAVVTNADVVWLIRPPEEHPQFDAPANAAARIEEAKRVEFGAEPDPRRAASLFDEALAVPDLTSRTRAWFLVLAAWSAHRTGAPDRTRRLLDELAKVPGPAYRAVSEGALLLCATRGDPLPNWAQEVFARLPSDSGRILLEELANRGADVATARARLETAHRQRRTILEARQLWPLLEDAEEPLLREGDGETIVFFPKSAGAGRGLILGRADLEAVLAPAARAAGVNLVMGPNRSDDATSVTEQSAVRPVEKSSVTETSALPLVVVGLGLVMVLALLLSLRGLSRETAAARTKAEFLTSVTHELKTPLASIRLLSEMLADGRVTTPTKLAEYYRLLAGESGRLSVLIDNVLDLGRLDRGERKLHLEPSTAATVLGSARELFAPLAAQDGFALVLDGNDDAPLRVDRAALVQALLNVMDNARKYAHSGGRLEVGITQRSSKVEIRLRDHGPGVASDESEHLFERFRRGAAQRDGSTPGVGLGLYLARTIARLHGGDLTSEAPTDGGPGACFVFTLPIPEKP